MERRSKRGREDGGAEEGGSGGGAKKRGERVRTGVQKREDVGEQKKEVGK